MAKGWPLRYARAPMRTREATNPWALTFLFVLSASVGCNRKIPEPQTVPAEPAPLTQNAAEQKPAEPEAAPTPPPEKKGPSEDFIGYPKEGWTKLKLNEETPLCVFANELERFNAKFVEQAKKQDLKAGKSVTFGTYGPYCINKECDDLPSLQCLVSRDGNTLNVRARYIGYHKDGASCSENCAEVTAGCETPVLEAGKYTVQYGDKQYTLKIPSKLSSACFKK
jgi:hypothetical protein